ncbi:MAG: PD-(D/E)XK nuclease family protein [Oscillospiraceae bacterium]|jgi:ATP-dependent helicase/nuclease subunit B
MLHLILGCAKSGKTAYILSKIRDAVLQKQGDQLLIVPEQYSHEAERELCRTCGDSLSLYGEVLSFTRLSSRVAQETGNVQNNLLDKGGRLLAMALALDAITPHLKLYRAARYQPELQVSLLSAIDELKSACIRADALADAAAHTNGMLRDKLQDLSLILSAFDSIVARSHADPAHRLDLLADTIQHSTVGNEGQIYVDGFIDFTQQELRVLAALLRKGADLTVCLTCDCIDGGSEVHDISRRSAAALLSLAKKAGQKSSVLTLQASSTAQALPVFIEQNLFRYTQAVWAGTEAVTCYAANSIVQECELAAWKIRTLVQDTGCRYRDIAVAIRGFDAYRPLLESIFRSYDIPLFLSRRSDILQRPICVLLFSALEIVGGGWEYEDVFSYLKTGLTGLSQEACDLLENYVLLWSLRGSAWTKNEPWTLSPNGYQQQKFADADETESCLRTINALRVQVSAPLLALYSQGKAAETAAEQAMALRDFLISLSLPEQLEHRSAELLALGLTEEAEEYRQLWEIIVSALEQFVLILGNTPMKQEEFSHLFRLVLSRYDVGTIPVSLDRVSAGDFDRVRRRNLKHLIVLGASDDRLPQVSDDTGIFTRDERDILQELELDIGDSTESLYREMALIYHCMTLPSDSLTVSYSTATSGGGEALPTFVLSRLATMFEQPIQPVPAELLLTVSKIPAFALAAQAGMPATSTVAAVTKRYFSQDAEQAAVLDRLAEAAAQTRGRLSARSVTALYGKRHRFSPTQIDTFTNCRYAYFLQYGLRLKPREPAGFNPPEYGTFLHYILEHVARDIMHSSEFSTISREETDALADHYTEQFIAEELHGLRNKSSRFVYLFRRLSRNVRQVVSDMVAELAHSDFRPLDFELRFAPDGTMPPLTLGEGEEQVSISGVADRVDGWIHEDKLYLRIADYKTGRKAFRLSDIYHGLNLQMLLYLFVLVNSGDTYYGKEIVPAGVLYIPARDILVSGAQRLTPEEVAAEQKKQLRRSGLILEDPAVIEAMEHGDTKQYIPVAFKKGVPSADNLASLEQFGKLSRHIEQKLQYLSRELRRGSITAHPLYQTPTENACIWCKYRSICQFDPTREPVLHLRSMKSQEVWEALEEQDEGGKQHG